MQNFAALENFKNTIAHLKESAALKPINLGFFSFYPEPLKDLNKSIAFLKDPLTQHIDSCTESAIKEDYTPTDMASQLWHVSNMLYNFENYIHRLEDNLTHLDKKTIEKDAVRTFVLSLSEMDTVLRESIYELSNEIDLFRPYFYDSIIQAREFQEGQAPLLAVKETQFQKKLDNFREGCQSSHLKNARKL